MDTGTLFLVQYLITIPLAVFALFFMPRRGTLSQYWENGRRNGALIGLLPCGPLSIIISAGFVGAYYLRIKAIEGKENSLAATWSSPTNSADAGNPFGSSSGQTPSASAPNSSRSGQGGNPNPFAADDSEHGPSDESGRSNPFA